MRGAVRGGGRTRRQQSLLWLAALTLGALTSCVGGSPGKSSSTTGDQQADGAEALADLDPDTLTIDDTRYALTVTDCVTDPVPLGSTDLEADVQRVMQLDATATAGPGTGLAHLEIFRLEGSGGSTTDSFRLYEGDRTKPDRSWEMTGGVGPLSPREGAPPPPPLAQRGLLFEIGDSAIGGGFDARVVQDYLPTGAPVEVQLSASCSDS